MVVEVHIYKISQAELREKLRVGLDRPTREFSELKFAEVLYAEILLKLNNLTLTLRREIIFWNEWPVLRGKKN
jgi:hypothetical protein